MFRKRDLIADLDGLEIGATVPGRLHFVVNAEEKKVTVKLTTEEARWLAGALNHWADSSETIPLN